MPDLGNDKGSIIQIDGITDLVRVSLFGGFG